MEHATAIRRERLLAQLPASAVVLVPAAREQTRSRDTEYPFRQSSDFWYLTAFPEPDALLILTKDAEGTCSELLLCRDKDPQAEVWQGRRYGTEQATALFGVPAVSISQQTEQLLQALKGKQQVYFCVGADAEFEQLVWSTLETIRSTPRQGHLVPTSCHDLRPLLHEMRLLKDAGEIALMQHAARISAEAHNAAMLACQPGLHEYQLEACILQHFAMQGARFPAYNSIVGGGENACILHYTENSDSLHDGDLVLIDAGCEYQGYAADITRTFPVNGRFSPEQKALYQLVLDAQLAALAQIKPGSSFKAAGDAASGVLTAGLLQLGILQGELDTLLAEQAAKPYMIHSLGHWLGLDVHDVGSYQATTTGEHPGEPGEKARLFEPGMVLTVEPGLYIPTGSGTDAKWWGIGIRIEDDVLITHDGHQVLTATVPKTVAEIEALMAGRAHGQFD